MSIEQSDSVDAIGINGTTGEVTLAIADHLDWSDGLRHRKLLQEKLNTYLRFLESGEVYDAYPKARGRPFVIEIVAKYEPTEAGQEFLENAGRVVDQAGFKIAFRRLSAE